MNDFDDLNDLDDVLGPLRSAARPAELVGESATVDFMVKAHRTSEEKHMFRSRSARIATLVAAGVLGFGGIAAAGSPISEEVLAAIREARAEELVEEPEEEIAEEETVEPETVEPETVEEQIAEPETVEEEIAEPELVEVKVVEDDPTEKTTDELEEDPYPETAFNEADCAEGNHGKTVSAVARGDSDFLEEYAENNPTASVPTAREAAHSLCGKIDDDDQVEDEAELRIETDESDDTEDADESKESDESEQPKEKAERPDRSDKGADRPGNGKSNGNGKRGG